MGYKINATDPGDDWKNNQDVINCGINSAYLCGLMATKQVSSLSDINGY